MENDQNMFFHVCKKNLTIWLFQKKSKSDKYSKSLKITKQMILLNILAMLLINYYATLLLSLVLIIIIKLIFTILICIRRIWLTLLIFFYISYN